MAASRSAQASSLGSTLAMLEEAAIGRRRRL